MELWLAGLLAAVFGLVAGVDYIFRIFGRTIFGWRKTAPTHPRAATWLVWAVMGLILASAYSSSGARETAWSAWAMAVEFVVVAVLAIIYDSRTRRLKPVGLWSYAIKDIDATEFFICHCDHPFDVLFLAYIGTHKFSPYTELRNHFLSRLQAGFRIEIRDNNVCALARITPRVGTADAIARAGDHCGAIQQTPLCR